jgi:cysteine-rich secretory family protein
MVIFRKSILPWLALAALPILAQRPGAQDLPSPNAQALPPQAEQLFALANRTRAAQGLGTLKWDPALATAAMQHCVRMAAEGPISHRYGGEPDLTARAGQAGAHFSLIEENIAVGPNPASVHQGWMNSPGHRANLLSPNINRVGIAVVGSGELIFAVADYSGAVPVLTPAQVEANFAEMLRAKGLTILQDASQARAYCASSGRFTGPVEPSLSSGRFTGPVAPSFLMRWQNPDVTQLPPDLAARVASGQYRQAAVGSCPAQDVEGSFTVYRVAVLLY